MRYVRTRSKRPVDTQPDDLELKAPWLPILMYHRVGDWSGRAGSYTQCVSGEEFEGQMRFLRQRGYRSISFKDLALMTLRGDRPRGKRVIITFDDGYRDVYEHAFPILQRYQFTATLFLVTGCIGGSNVWDRGGAEGAPLLRLREIEDMKEHGMDFGSHSATHRPLTELDAKTARGEILDSKADLEEQLGLEVLSFSFPYGRSNSAVRQLVRQAGYLAACGIEQREHTLFNLSRVDADTCRGSRLRWWWKVSGLHYRLRQSHTLRALKGVLARGPQLALPNRNGNTRHE